MRLRTGLGPVAACCALFAFPHFAAAQIKVAVVNMQAAVLGTAEIRKADADMQTKYAPRQTEINNINAEAAKIQQQMQAGQDKLSAAQLADLNSQLTRHQRELQRLNEDTQADVEKDKNDVLTTAAQKMAGVLKKLAEERGYDFVLEATTTNYWKDALDITSDVTAAYDKTYPVAAAPKPAAK